MSHTPSGRAGELAVQLRDLAVLTAAIGDIVGGLDSEVVDLSDLRLAHAEHIGAFADAVFRTVRAVRAAGRPG